MQLIDSWRPMLTGSYYTTVTPKKDRKKKQFTTLILGFCYLSSFFGRDLLHHEVAKLLRHRFKLAFEDALIRDAAAEAGVALDETS